MSAQPAGGDQHVHMVEQRARPGVEHSEQARTRPEVARVSGEFEERGGGRGHEETVDVLLMRAGEGSQLRRQRERQQEGRARQQAGALPVQPALGLLAVALGAVAVATRVVAVLARAAVIARPNVAAQGRSAAGHDVTQGAPLRGQQRQGMKPLIDLARRADDARALEHRRSGDAEPLHQAIDRIDRGLADLWGEMGVDLRGPSAPMAEGGLDEAEIHAVFEQVGRVGVPPVWTCARWATPLCWRARPKADWRLEREMGPASGGTK